MNECVRPYCRSGVKIHLGHENRGDVFACGDLFSFHREHGNSRKKQNIRE